MHSGAVVGYDRWQPYARAHLPVRNPGTERRGEDHHHEEIRGRIGYLPQNPRFYDHMSARQIIRFQALQYFRGPRQAIERRVQESLALVGLADRADRPIRGFSGGERQRLGLAQAQVNRPELLILDEPAANLDPIGRRDVLALIEGLRAAGAGASAWES